MEIKLEDFAKQVEAMRKSQKNYFRYHSKKDLKECIQLERNIDELIKTILKDIPIFQQQNLFL